MEAKIKEDIGNKAPQGDGFFLGSPRNCKLCKGRANHFCYVDFNKSCNNYPLERSGISVEYFKCKECDLVFTDFCDNWLPSDFKKFIYNDEYILVDPGYTGARSVINAELFSRILEPARNLSILDYGGGNGGLSKQLMSFGFSNCQTYDPFGENNILPTKKFDIVLSFEVVEHSPDPEYTFEQILNLVKDNGVAIIGQSMQPKNIDDIRGGWWYLAPRNGHITFYSHKTMLDYAKSKGIKYRDAGGWIVLYRGNLPSEIQRVLDFMPERSKYIKAGAPFDDLVYSQWHALEDRKNEPFRWTAEKEVSLGDYFLIAGTNIISINYRIKIEQDFSEICYLRVNSEFFPVRDRGEELFVEVDAKKSGIYNLTLVTKEPKQPSSLNLNDDIRYLGIAICCI